MTLSDRLRTLVKAPRRETAVPNAPVARGDIEQLESVLGGCWSRPHGARVFVVSRRWTADTVHGAARVGDIAERLLTPSGSAALLAGVPTFVRSSPERADCGPCVFFDLETTGLSGGAGTYAFLIGCGWCEVDGTFETKQYLLVDYTGERAILQALAADLASAGSLVTFNGKSFDAPVIETRCSFHRLDWVGAGLPHLDMLHAARPFWGGEGCSLGALEAHVLGAARCADVPGFEIPGRYFQFLRSGDAKPLLDVFTHNQLDLLSLAALTARLLDVVERGPAATSDPQEALALGAVYQRAGLSARAREAFERSVCLSDLRPTIRVAALRALALAARRNRRYEEADGWWRRALVEPRCPPPTAREAAEALAIHAEHRARDLVAARVFALRSLDEGARPAWNDAVHHRLERLSRKVSAVEERLNTEATQNRTGRLLLEVEG